jgi:hypothetical protein
MPRDCAQSMRVGCRLVDVLHACVGAGPDYGSHRCTTIYVTGTALQAARCATASTPGHTREIPPYDHGAAFPGYGLSCWCAGNAPALDSSSPYPDSEQVEGLHFFLSEGYAPPVRIGYTQLGDLSHIVGRALLPRLAIRA